MKQYVLEPGPGQRQQRLLPLADQHRRTALGQADPPRLRERCDVSEKLGAVVVGIRPAIDEDAAVALARLRFGKPDLGKLRIGINRSRDDPGTPIPP